MRLGTHKLRGNGPSEMLTRRFATLPPLSLSLFLSAYPSIYLLLYPSRLSPLVIFELAWQQALSRSSDRFSFPPQPFDKRTSPSRALEVIPRGLFSKPIRCLAHVPHTFLIDSTRFPVPANEPTQQWFRLDRVTVFPLEQTALFYFFKRYIAIFIRFQIVSIKLFTRNWCKKS